MLVKPDSFTQYPNKYENWTQSQYPTAQSSVASTVLILDGKIGMECSLLEIVQ